MPFSRYLAAIPLPPLIRPLRPLCGRVGRGAATWRAVCGRRCARVAAGFLRVSANQWSRSVPERSGESDNHPTCPTRPRAAPKCRGARPAVATRHAVESVAGHQRPASIPLATLPAAESSAPSLVAWPPPDPGRRAAPASSCGRSRPRPAGARHRPADHAGRRAARPHL